MNELEKNFLDNYNSLIEKAQSFRFIAIESAIQIESLISQNLIDLLGNNETKESLSKYLFSDTTTFETKVNLFNSLNKKKIFQPSINNKNLNSDLIYLKTVRNYMAHANLINNTDVISKFNGRELTFVSFTSRGERIIKILFYEKKDNIDKLVFSYNVLALKANRTRDSLVEIQRWLNERNKDET